MGSMKLEVVRGGLVMVAVGGGVMAHDDGELVA